MTEYEKELSKREIKVNGKFIFRGEIYKAVVGDCEECVFTSSEACELVPECCRSGDPLMVCYVKEGK